MEIKNYFTKTRHTNTGDWCWLFKPTDNDLFVIMEIFPPNVEVKSYALGLQNIAKNTIHPICFAYTIEDALEAMQMFFNENFLVIDKEAIEKDLQTYFHD